MEKVLVIGGSGFAGRHLVAELKCKGIDVYAIEHRVALAATEKITIVKGGIKAVDRKLIDTIRPDVVFHLARPTFPRLMKAGRILAARYAARLNRNLIKELEYSINPPTLVFASGSLMYGQSPVPATEDQPLRPISYARQYFPGEMPVLDALQKSRISVKIIRFPWLLGLGSWFDWFYLKTMREKHAIPLFGQGDNRMEIIDVKDAVKLMLRYADDQGGKGVYNILSSGAITQLDFISKLNLLTGYPVKDHRELFTGKIEKEAIEAFTSTIVLATKYPEIPAGFQYTPLHESLKRITGKI